MYKGRRSRCCAQPCHWCTPPCHWCARRASEASFRERSKPSVVFKSPKHVQGEAEPLVCTAVPLLCTPCERSELQGFMVNLEVHVHLIYKLKDVVPVAL